MLLFVFGMVNVTVSGNVIVNDIGIALDGVTVVVTVSVTVFGMVIAIVIVSASGSVHVHVIVCGMCTVTRSKRVTVSMRIRRC